MAGACFIFGVSASKLVLTAVFHPDGERRQRTILDFFSLNSWTLICLHTEFKNNTSVPHPLRFSRNRIFLKKKTFYCAIIAGDRGTRMGLSHLAPRPPPLLDSPVTPLNRRRRRKWPRGRGRRGATWFLCCFKE